MDWIADCGLRTKNNGKTTNTEEQKANTRPDLACTVS